MGGIDDKLKELTKRRFALQTMLKHLNSQEQAFRFRFAFKNDLSMGKNLSEDERDTYREQRRRLNSEIENYKKELKETEDEIRKLESEKEKESLSSVWSIRGLPDKERLYATEQAQKEGITIANWMAKAIQNQAALDLKGGDGNVPLKMLPTSKLREIISLIGELKSLGCEPPKEIMAKLYEHINREI